MSENFRHMNKNIQIVIAVILKIIFSYFSDDLDGENEIRWQRQNAEIRKRRKRKFLSR